MKVAKQTRTGGFTLIELIVVIAILGILAGVGTVAYTGYVQYAHKGVDKQTVGDLIYATQLADYANPSLFGNDGTAMIAITSNNGTQAAGTYETEALKKALTDAVGDLAAIGLTYDKWAGAVDANTLKSMKDSLANEKIGFTNADGTILYTDSEGNAATTSYAASADQLWDMVADVAAQWSNGKDKNANQYMALAAQYTVNSGIASADYMGGLWSQQSIGAAGITGESEYAVNAAVLATQTARNYAFAEYLKASGANIDAAVLSQLQTTAGDQVTSFMADTPITGTEQVYVDNWEALHKAAEEYLTNDVYTDGTNWYSQAYLDGLIYYALMYNINDVTQNGTYDTGSSDYLSNIGGYVSVAGTVFSGKMEWEDIANLADDLAANTAGSSVVITVSKSNGALSFKVSPEEADPRDEDMRASGESTSCVKDHIEQLTIDSAGRGGAAVSTNSIVICSTDSSHGVCEIKNNAAATITITAGGEHIQLSQDGKKIVAVSSGEATLQVKRGSSTLTVTVTVH